MSVTAPGTSQGSPGVRTRILSWTVRAKGSVGRKPVAGGDRPQQSLRAALPCPPGCHQVDRKQSTCPPSRSWHRFPQPAWAARSRCHTGDSLGIAKGDGRTQHGAAARSPVAVGLMGEGFGQGSGPLEDALCPSTGIRTWQSCLQKEPLAQWPF